MAPAIINRSVPVLNGCLSKILSGFIFWSVYPPPMAGSTFNFQPATIFGSQSINPNIHQSTHPPQSRITHHASRIQYPSIHSSKNPFIPCRSSAGGTSSTSPTLAFSLFTLPLIFGRSAAVCESISRSASKDPAGLNLLRLSICGAVPPHRASSIKHPDF